MVLFNPLTMYWLDRKELPQAKYVDFYLMNAWLAMEFLEKEKLCSNPQLQKGIYEKLARVRDTV